MERVTIENSFKEERNRIVFGERQWFQERILLK